MEKFGISEMLKNLGLNEVNNGASTGANWLDTSGELLESYSPTDGRLIGSVKQGNWDDYEKIMAKAQEAFKVWRMVPAPKRGEII